MYQVRLFLSAERTRSIPLLSTINSHVGTTYATCDFKKIKSIGNMVVTVATGIALTVQLIEMGSAYYLMIQKESREKEEASQKQIEDMF